MTPTPLRMAGLATFLAAMAMAVSVACASPWRSLATRAPAGPEVEGIDRFAIALQHGDHDAARVALEVEGWPAHLRAWARARLDRADADTVGAMAHYAEAAARWPRTGAGRGRGFEEVLATFDRERLETALGAEKIDAARRILARPLHSADDPLWRALAAWVALAEGRAHEAAGLFDAAWRDLAPRDRGRPALLRRAFAHLAAGDSTTARAAWAEAVDEIRRPEHHRAAHALWDSHPDLRTGWTDAPARDALLRWLVRTFRRDDALAVARAALAQTSEPDESAELFVFVAEQLYRLRRHDELQIWLDQPWPAGANDEQRAELECYPLGVQRRSGHSVALGAGFDGVALHYPGTRRAVEALWEGAWMWELSGELDVAVVRYDEIRRQPQDDRYASAAGLRGLWLRTRLGRTDEVVSTFDALDGSLSDGLDDAGALRLRADVDPARAEPWLERLASDHPFSPFLVELPDPVGTERADTDLDEEIERLHAVQVAAFDRVRRHLAFDGSREAELQGIAELARLGVFTEAEVRLAAWAAARRSDTAAVFRAVEVAWEGGLAEVQGRYGWILERRLRDDGPEIARAVRIVAQPTPYAGAVLAAGRRHRIDPWLVWGLVRRESFYDADVVSIAGAYGLMQLLPSTARDVASRLGDPEPTPEDLLRPSVNVGLGVAYLRGLLDRADQDRVRALAAYNAGERNGRRWQERRRPDDDEAYGIFDVSYSETRAYVYHVLRHWLRYRAHYAGATPSD